MVLHYIVSDNAEVMHHPEVGVSDSDAGAKSNIHRRLRHNPEGSVLGSKAIGNGNVNKSIVLHPITPPRMSMDT
ncbi:hypothetical protein M0657_000547 [Pyricularia oryzae]|nr:hypothetical protein M9X92_000630 [Pyricularia oryzae]KAI7932417.1 hypothetical protein M0657_000547 [Pyricularia oryzae]